MNRNAIYYLVNINCSINKSTLWVKCNIPCNDWQVDPKDAESDFGEGLRLNPIGPAFAGAGVGAGDGSGTPPISPNMGTAVSSSVVGDGSRVVSPPSPSPIFCVQINL